MLCYGKYVRRFILSIWAQGLMGGLGLAHLPDIGDDHCRVQPAMALARYCRANCKPNPICDDLVRRRDAWKWLGISTTTMRRCRWTARGLRDAVEGLCEGTVRSWTGRHGGRQRRPMLGAAIGGIGMIRVACLGAGNSGISHIGRFAAVAEGELLWALPILTPRGRNLARQGLAILRQCWRHEAGPCWYLIVPPAGAGCARYERLWPLA